ncbi:hypothetical protein RND71_003003 [Anisodus tanguticus]|uniref:Ammonium transporter AmtB-like domain-containing protein n=1 Tax=Anisodus tanguticus TaxID=243964 RepID=A0AAE1SV46_9SOLA|nr:hypothetical protein RND71_003003 [Anisodus tanguticus]
MCLVGLIEALEDSEVEGCPFGMVPSFHQIEWCSHSSYIHFRSEKMQSEIRKNRRQSCLIVLLNATYFHFSIYPGGSTDNIKNNTPIIFILIDAPLKIHCLSHQFPFDPGGSFIKKFYYLSDSRANLLFLYHIILELISKLDSCQQKMDLPNATMVLFQFVFTTITLILIAGAVLERINMYAWMLFVPLWLTFSYTFGAYTIWTTGGWLSVNGIIDYSGGYIIHLSSGVVDFTAAYWVGPRSTKDRKRFPPNNILLMLAGAGLLWMGWT